MGLDLNLDLSVNRQ